jgi:hypothetical protein
MFGALVAVEVQLFVQIDSGDVALRQSVRDN